MKFIPLLLLCILTSNISIAQTKGFLFVKSGPAVPNLRFPVQASRCVQWKSDQRNVDACAKFEKAVEIKTDQYEPLPEGFYQITSGPMGRDLMTEVVLGKATTLSVSTFNSDTLALKSPKLKQYLGNTDYSFKIHPDFKSHSSQLKAEKMTRALINEAIDKPYEAAAYPCRTEKTIRQFIHEGKLPICNEGQVKEIPIKLTPEAQRIVDISETDLSLGIWNNKYEVDGQHQLYLLYNGFALLNADGHFAKGFADVSTAYFNSYTTTFSGVPFNKRTDSIYSSKEDENVILFPGSYIIIISERYRSEAIDVISLTIP